MAVGLFVVGCSSNTALHQYCDGTPKHPCNLDPRYPVCDVATMNCVAATPDLGVFDLSVSDLNATDGMVLPPDLAPMCTSASGCTNPAAPICDPSTQTCRACTATMADNSQCSMHSVGEVCVTSGASNGHCGACNPTTPPTQATGVCTTTTAPICDATGVCRACQQNSECSSQLCCTAGDVAHDTGCRVGACVDPTTLVYVNNAPTAHCSSSNPGTSPAPFCTINQALAAVTNSGSNAPILVLPGTGYPESISIVNTEVSATIIGSGNPVVSPSAKPIVEFFDTEREPPVSMYLTLDGFIFDGGNASGGIICNGGTNIGYLTINRSTIRNGNAANQVVGVSAQGCLSLSMDADVIEANAYGGIVLDFTNATLTNLLIEGNGSATSPNGALSILDNSTVELINATLVNNTATVPALACDTSTQTIPILNTVLFNNTPSDISNCTGASYSAYKGAGTTNHNQDLNSCTAQQLFVGSGANPYLPVKGGTLPCTLVDDGTAASPAPSHDLLGTPRPQGAGFDIGAYEAP